MPNYDAELAEIAMGRMIDFLVARKAVLTKMFRTVDADQSGAIDARELGNALTTLGLRLSRRELNAIMNHLDSDGNGEIDLPEFLEHFKRERAKRFDGHVPELKDAKQALVNQMRAKENLGSTRADGLYRTLVNIETLQGANDLSPPEVKGLRSKIVSMVNRGMQLEPDEEDELDQLAAAAAASSAEESKLLALRARSGPKLPGPKLGPAMRTRRRLDSAERAFRKEEALYQEELKRFQRKRGPAAGRRSRRLTFNEAAAARKAAVSAGVHPDDVTIVAASGVRAHSTPPTLERSPHAQADSPPDGLVITEPSRQHQARRQAGTKMVERDGKYIWQRVGSESPSKLEVAQGMQKELVSSQVQRVWDSPGLDMARTGIDNIGRS